MSKIITCDFDDTFDLPHVQEYLKDKIKNGYTIYILTYRFDELNKHRYPRNPSNEDLYKSIKKLDIPKENVIFMNTNYKGEYLSHTLVEEHIDDNVDELQKVRRYAPHVKIIHATPKNLIDLTYVRSAELHYYKL